MRWCFLQLGKTYATTKRKLGIPKDLVELSILSFCCRELICDSAVRASRACPSKPPDKNQSITCKSKRFDLRLSQSRFTNNDQKNLTNAVPQQGFGQQHTALSKKLRRYARMHTCNPWPVLEHMAQTHALPATHHFYLLGIQKRASPVRDDNSHSAKARIFLILALPERESSWWSKASRRSPSQEWRTWRKELFRFGVEKATSSDCKTVFPSQTTQQQCRSSSLEGRSDFMSPANHTRSKDWKSKMLPRTWRR